MKRHLVLLCFFYLKLFLTGGVVCLKTPCIPVILQDYCRSNQQNATEILLHQRGPTSCVTVILSKTLPLESNCDAKLTLQTEGTGIIAAIQSLDIPQLSEDECYHSLQISGASHLNQSDDTTADLLCGHLRYKTLISKSQSITIQWTVHEIHTKVEEDDYHDDIMTDQRIQRPYLSHVVSSDQLEQQEAKVHQKSIAESNFVVVFTSFKEPDDANGRSCLSQHGEEWFMCAHQRCIDSRWYCDGTSQCGDVSDESANCPNASIKAQNLSKSESLTLGIGIAISLVTLFVVFLILVKKAISAKTTDIRRKELARLYCQWNANSAASSRQTSPSTTLTSIKSEGYHFNRTGTQWYTMLNTEDDDVLYQIDPKTRRKNAMVDVV